ncbi:phosphotransferase [Zooshikella ganghwensis]|uniref:phosphotransferase n=1 Tax=Zooshikella ganghwensis TaxID=202772 RepID=UPI00041C6E1A|nr:phosphotransferase [Zooshikella ganghwensis]
MTAPKIVIPKTTDEALSLSGTDSLERIPARGRYSEEARQTRLDFLREKSGQLLSGVDKTSLRADQLRFNIENFVGSVEVPIGLSGPLLFNGQHVTGTIYTPLATTEGALVASATRGATALSKSGGVNTAVLSQRMIRTPFFKFDCLASALHFSEWLRKHFITIKEKTRQRSRHAELIELKPLILGRMIHLNFIYQTGDASGQNMTTSCTWHACQWILQEYQPRHTIEQFFIEANLASDKKTSYQSFLSGRGTRVIAEAHIPENILQQILKVSAKELVSAYQAGITGSIQAGIPGVNANVANIIAAIFTATGQDIACVHESSLAHLHIEQTEQGIYACLLLPGLVVGTVGGGTGLPQQQECLALLDCAGSHRSARFAEIIAGFSLSLDLSTLSAIASGQFAAAHDRLGRNRPIKFLRKEELTPAFFQEHMGELFNTLEHIEISEAPCHAESIVCRLTAEHTTKFLGLLPAKLYFQHQHQPLQVMLKIKPTDEEAIHTLRTLAQFCDPRLAEEIKRAGGTTFFKGCHQREMQLYQLNDSRFTSIAPQCFGQYQNQSREIFLLALEWLDSLTLMNTVDDLAGWHESHIMAAITGIAEFHSLFLGQERQVFDQFNICAMNQTTMVQLQPLWRLLQNHGLSEFPEWFSEQDQQQLQLILENLPMWWGILDRQPKTLIHGDFNPRNLAFRQTNNQLKLCAWDWELATWHLPQRDCVELLAFTLKPEQVTPAFLSKFSEYHRQQLAKAANTSLDKTQWHMGFHYSLLDFTVNRLAHYWLANTLQDYPFMARLTATTLAMINALESTTTQLGGQHHVD